MPRPLAKSAAPPPWKKWIPITYIHTGYNGSNKDRMKITIEWWIQRCHNYRFPCTLQRGKIIGQKRKSVHLNLLCYYIKLDKIEIRNFDLCTSIWSRIQRSPRSDKNDDWYIILYCSPSFSYNKRSRSEFYPFIKALVNLTGAKIRLEESVRESNMDKRWSTKVSDKSTPDYSIYVLYVENAAFKIFFLEAKTSKSLSDASVCQTMGGITCLQIEFLCLSISRMCYYRKWGHDY